MSHELPSRVVNVENGNRGNLQATIEIGNIAYPLVCTSSFGPEVKNPSDSVVRAYLNGNLPKPHPESPTTLLVPIQADDRCAANCKGCVFARDIVGGGFLAKPTSPEILEIILEHAKAVMAEHHLLGPNGQLRVGALLAGDPSFNPYTTELITVFGSHPEIISLRMSTIALDTKWKSLKAFINGAKNLKRTGSRLKFRQQASIHSTDAQKRLDHISFHGAIGPRPTSLLDISTAFTEFFQITGSKSTLAFVVDSSTDIDPAVLAAYFNPINTDISLRPIISTTKYTAVAMQPDKFIALKNLLIDGGWDVRVIPSSEKGIEQANTLTRDLPVLGQGVLGL